MNKKPVIFIVVALIAVLFYFVTPYYLFLTKTLKVSLLKTLFSSDSLKIVDNQVNILALGIAGGTHEGPNLSDSIMVVNYNLKTNQLTTVSLPRDIWSSDLEDKINTAYAYGEARAKGKGLELAKREIAKVIGKPIQYAVVIDFDKFKDLINLLGGIDVTVDRSFVDNEFPIPGKENDLCGNDPDYGCRYESVSFTAGPAHMDGETALNFVRSRHAKGDEGSDFARTKRQQKVVEAVKNKLISLAKKNDFVTLEKLYLTFDKSANRDITNQQIAILVKKIVLSLGFHQKQAVLSEDMFVVPDYSDYGGAYVLIPKSGSFDLIHQYIDCNIKGLANCEALK